MMIVSVGHGGERDGLMHQHRLEQQVIVLGRGPDQEAGCVLHEQHRQPECIARAEQPDYLVAALRRDRAGHVHRLAGDHADADPADSGQPRQHAAADAGPQLEEPAVVDQMGQDPAHVVGLAQAGRDHRADPLRRPGRAGRRPLGRCGPAVLRQVRQEASDQIGRRAEVIGGTVDLAGPAIVHIDAAEFIEGRLFAGGLGDHQR